MRQDEEDEEKFMALEPFADAFFAMGQRMRGTSDELLVTIFQRSQQCTVTNCWFATYEAAQWLKIEVPKEQSRRAYERKRDAAKAGGSLDGR